jgi:hypothetical protein
LGVERLLPDQPLLDLAVRRQHHHRFLHKYVLCIHQDHLFVIQTCNFEKTVFIYIMIYIINVLLYHRPTVKTTDISK